MGEIYLDKLLSMVISFNVLLRPQLMHCRVKEFRQFSLTQPIPCIERTPNRFPHLGQRKFRLESHEKYAKTTSGRTKASGTDIQDESSATPIMPTIRHI